ncbi:MAG: malate synthase G [SAR86 cluster bacterium]|nr:malate synthase G [SAR86 cluster bacterium]
MTERSQYGNLQVAKELDKLLIEEILPGLNISEEEFWDTFNHIVEEFVPRNKSLIKDREDLQNQIDQWHLDRRGQKHNHEEYKTFLKEIGYWVEGTKDFQITTSEVDPEISQIAGPQLVVPVMNARFSLNAANARWGSLYDALYGTDMISEEGGAERGSAYNPVRGDKVIEFSKSLLNKTIPLSQGSYQEVTSFQINEGKLEVNLSDQSKVSLLDTEKFIGFRGEPDNPTGILFKNNKLHIEIQVDREDSVGKDDAAGIKDILIESAVTTIQDLEDSIAAVDAEDKATVYRNWLGLMKGDLKETFIKGGSELTRKLNPDREYKDAAGKEFKLSGRSLMLVRNVGHLMTNPAILDKTGEEIPEGILDAIFTICIAKHDLEGNGSLSNSETGSVYIVKPKMHGPKEVEFTCDLFAAIEKGLKLKPLSVKIGIMDEERRTTINLKECIEAAKDRVIFINTGFLDRTGDEIHTSMEAGPMVPKALMKQQPWINAYEDWNVDKGLETGFKGRAQIGKGMWPMPDEMLEMYETKTVHPEAGANCAWVPSPTAATLHALHYHQVSVSDTQDKLKERAEADIDSILTIPLLEDPSLLTDKEIQNELDNNAQGILGYVVRWIDQGVGCSKVPDINDVGLMEDRATCRISSQHMANWLHHGLCTEEQVIETMKKMALVVDKQNEGDPDYINMAPSFEGVAFKAACDLVLQGRIQPSGYTEPILHKRRLEFKS